MSTRIDIMIEGTSYDTKTTIISELKSKLSSNEIRSQLNKTIYDAYDLAETEKSKLSALSFDAIFINHYDLHLRCRTDPKALLFGMRERRTNELCIGHSNDSMVYRNILNELKISNCRILPTETIETSIIKFVKNSITKPQCIDKFTLDKELDFREWTTYNTCNDKRHKMFSDIFSLLAESNFELHMLDDKLYTID